MVNRYKEDYGKGWVMYEVTYFGLFTFCLVLVHFVKLAFCRTTKYINEGIVARFVRG